MIFGKHINKYYAKYLWMLLIGLAALSAVDYFQLEIPAIYGAIIDGLDPRTEAVLTAELLRSLCFRMIGVIAVMVLGRFLWRICFFGAAIRVETDIRDEMFGRCKTLSQQFYQVNKVGNLMSLFTNDLETVNECFGEGVMMFFDAAILGGMAIIRMSRLNLTLSLLSLIPMVFLCAIGVIVGGNMQKKWQKRQEAFSELSDFSQESFSGIAVIKAFVKETAELMAFRDVNKRNEKANIEYTKVSVLLNVLVTLFIQSVICIVLGFGGYLAYKGIFTASKLIEFISYFNTVTWPIMAVSMLIEKTSRGRASLKRIGDLIDTKQDVTDSKDASALEGIKGDIEFRGLTFRYPGAEYDALKNVSVKISAGDSVGIIGKTGSGKTTFADLILRTYNVPDGTLFIDGHDVNAITIDSVRAASAYVPQDNFLFSDTVRRNIALSRGGEATVEEVAAASALASVSANIEEFTDKYETRLGERGVTVSGGQKQRISIARALLKDSSILILDDSVSAVDTQTEKEIIGNLRETRKGKTTLLIAHRMTTIEQMDKVLFIDDGNVVDFGPHEELYERCPEYRKMVELQRLEEEIGGKNS